MSENLLLLDGCKESIDSFWARTSKNPAQELYVLEDGKPRCWMCGWTSKSKDPRYLKSHLKITGHKWSRVRAHRTARKDVRKAKFELAQEHKQYVYWGNKQVSNVWQFVYLGSVFQSDGSHMADVTRRITRAKARAGKLRNFWGAPVPIKLKLRLYLASVCSILTYGSES